MFTTHLALLTTCLAAILIQHVHAEDPKPPQEKKTLPVFKTYTMKMKMTASHGISRWDEIYCDEAGGRAKLVVTQGAKKAQTATYFLEKEGAHGTEVTFYGRYGVMSHHVRPCSVWRGTEKKPVKIERFFMNLTDYEFKHSIKWNGVDTEVYSKKDGSSWYVHKKDEKITLIEKMYTNPHTVHPKSEWVVSFFSTNPIEETTFKYLGKLEDCAEEKEVEFNDHYNLD